MTVHTLTFDRVDDDRPFGNGQLQSGIMIILVFLGGLFTWGFLAPIESAVVAPGIVQVDSVRKTIQHLSGGIVKQILIKEGDQVNAGDELIRLDDTRQLALFNQLRAQYFDAVAAISRLLAERNDFEEVSFPEELLEQQHNPDAEQAINSQRRLFESRRNLRLEQQQALKQRLNGLEEEVKAIKQQIDAGERQQKASKTIIGLYNKLDKARNVTLQKLELELENAKIAGDVSEMRISLVRANQLMLEKRLEYSQFMVNERKLIEEELRVLNTQLYELRQNLTVAENELHQSVITAKIQGEIVGLQVHSIGGVIMAGDPLMDIVPTNDELVVETSINVDDIDQVFEGSKALVELTSANHRYSQPIEGQVKWVSADSLIDPLSGQSFYKARVELDKTDLQQKNLRLQPGMAADVMIHTGSRTALEYLSNPIARSLGHAMREK